MSPDVVETGGEFTVPHPGPSRLRARSATPGSMPHPTRRPTTPRTPRRNDETPDETTEPTDAAPVNDDAASTNDDAAPTNDDAGEE